LDADLVDVVEVLDLGELGARRGRLADLIVLVLGPVDRATETDEDDDARVQFGALAHGLNSPRSSVLSPQRFRPRPRLLPGAWSFLETGDWSLETPVTPRAGSRRCSGGGPRGDARGPRRGRRRAPGCRGSSCPRSSTASACA